MTYSCTVPAVFLARPNRFIAEVLIEGEKERVHVKNTGRCRELLTPGAKVFLAPANDPNRKTRYDLVAVEKVRENAPPLLINMDSQVVNAAAEEWLKTVCSAATVIRREVTFGASRFDFFIEDGSRRGFLEVKGVTLEKNGVARFPDAPTERGVKHLNELCAARAAGYEAAVLFVIQMKEIARFEPNDATHAAFGDALRRAAKCGVRILAMDCAVTPDSITIDSPIPVVL